MIAKKRAIKSNLAKVDRHRLTAAEYDEAPEITSDMLARAEIREGEKVVRRGRPPISGVTKTSVTLRLDTAIVQAYRRTGQGWQSRINADLQRAARKLKSA